MSTDPDPANRRRAVVIAGHRGDVTVGRAALDDEDAGVRVAALGALDRAGALTDDEVVSALADHDPAVRRRACELAASRPRVSLRTALDDREASVVEVAAWACGEQLQRHHTDAEPEIDAPPRDDTEPEIAADDRADDRADDVVERLVHLTTEADDALVREACAAALGAIGDPRGLPAILAACADKPHVRRRAVLALAPFDGDEVDAAIDRALDDRDWQVRQAAEDLRRAAGERPL